MINWEVIIWTCITLAVIMGVIGLILYAISAKNMRNKRKELGEVHTDMKVGSRIMFAGGIYGKIVSMEDRYYYFPLCRPEHRKIIALVF